MTTRLDRKLGCHCRCLAVLFAVLSAVTAYAEPGNAEQKNDVESSGRPARKHYFRSFLGQKPLELETEPRHWVNTEEKLTLQQLHGEVVWLEFNF